MPTTSEAAIQLEVLRRTRQDFRYTDKQLLNQLKLSIPDVTQKDVDRWREAGVLQARRIDGENRYFREAVGNLFRASEEARGRRKAVPTPPKQFDVTGLIVELGQPVGEEQAEVVPFAAADVAHGLYLTFIVNVTLSVTPPD